MVRAGYITQAQAGQARRTPLALRAAARLRRRLRHQRGAPAARVDPRRHRSAAGRAEDFHHHRLAAADRAEGALAARIAEIEKSKGEEHTNGFGDPNTGLPDENVLEGAFFAEDPANGAIRAVVGSRDFAVSQYDRAMQARRQVGSTIKPLLYATAFAEKGYCPASTIDSSKFDMVHAQNGVVPEGDPPDPLRVNDALVKSDDPSAVRMGIILGPDLVADYARRCGVTSDIPPYPSSYLGACQISLNEAHRHLRDLRQPGRVVKQHLVVQVRDENDNVLYQFQPEGHRVFTPQVARQVTGMMQNVLDLRHRRPGEGTVRLHRAGRGQDRHDERLQGRALRGLHHAPGRRRLDRLRHAEGNHARRLRRHGRAAGLGQRDEAGARRLPDDRLPGPAGPVGDQRRRRLLRPRRALLPDR
ncbi:MAG: penicillin-binding transpeptidase domain-containing protein [Verrucomicrobiota bacterium]